ncbi:alcohol dehydrogenase catalytic domain-containing protein [Agromyces sp. H66]|uniref:zinc-dependent alcohol dehydrogenase n=1 Tax=Agromyces sp. H66 TaxID=2529859 RepID=UPI001B7D8260|nr:alcohol dehydrogenase catalytic domain-containing protein [Agromyces sp. H66]
MTTPMTGRRPSISPAADPSPTAMRALVLAEFRRMTVEQRPTPEPGPGDVRLRIVATGICGSDVHGFTGENGRRSPGQVMGHEAAGIVDALGAGVESPAVGTTVVVHPTISCGRCRSCRMGHDHLCAERSVIGVDPDRSSTFADYLVIPAANAVPFAGSPDHGAVVEPLAVGWHAVNRGRLEPGENVVVIGGGPIGQAVALAAARRGAARVTVTEPVATRRALVARLGAEAIDPDDAAAFHALPGADLVVDAVGDDRSLRAALELAVPGGRCVLVGMASPRLEVAAYDISTQERAVVGAFCYTAEEFAETARWAASAPDLVDPLVSATIPLEEAPAMFGRLADGAPVAGKVLIGMTRGAASAVTR